PSDLVWRNGMSGWSPILSVPELAPTAPLHRFGEPPPPERGPQGDTPSIRRTAPPAPGVGKILPLGGAGLCFINFFLSWWGLSVTAPTNQESANRIRDVEPIFQRSLDWWNRRLTAEAVMKVRRVYDPNTPDVRFSTTLMGWRTGAGIMGFL